MTVREKILADLQQITNPDMLNQILEFLRLITRGTVEQSKSNKELVLGFAGCLTNEEAESMKKLVEEEFNQIEGEW
jgi:hypothetical protein